MLPQDFDSISPEHIQQLFDNEVAESPRLEFKRELLSKQTEERKNVLYEIAAFANTDGGDLLFGITDRKDGDNKNMGIADGCTPLTIVNQQEQIAQLENAVRDSIDPHIDGLRLRVVKHPDGDVLILRVPKSWNAPHMVTYNSYDKFYARNTTGKYPMTARQIGEAFSRQAVIGDRLDEWRNRRMELLESGRAPVGFNGHSALVIQVVPVESLYRSKITSDWRVPSNTQMKIAIIPQDIADTRRYTAEGFAVYPSWNQGQTSFTHLLRNGAIEYVDSSLLTNTLEQGNVRAIAGQYLEQYIIKAVENALSIMPDMGITSPVFICVTLSGVSGMTLPRGPLSFLQPRIFTEHNIRIPEVEIGSVQAYKQEQLLPLINLIWQASGVESTPHMIDGKWAPFGNYRF